MNRPTLCSLIALLSFSILTAQETLQSVTENGNTTNRRIILDSGAVVSNDNLFIDGTSITGKAPLEIIGNPDSIAINIQDGAIRFEKSFDANVGGPSSVLLGYSSSGKAYLKRDGAGDVGLRIESQSDGVNPVSSSVTLGTENSEDYLQLFNETDGIKKSSGIRISSGNSDYKDFKVEYGDNESSYPVMTLSPDSLTTFHGSVAVNTIPSTEYRLAVGGTILAESATVKLKEEWPDYVFKDSYDLLSLKDLEVYIKKNGKLPNIPSAKEIEKNGMNVGEINRNLVEKVEELTLYMIQLSADLKKLQQRNEHLLEKLKSQEKL
ncbi:hypothetical protein ACNKXS_13805 [Christiangramia marina]|uniref:hypothetical protein n=1 Tax=Christiangramia marina TaxID=409436 RepID=UPI003AA8B25D